MIMTYEQFAKYLEEQGETDARTTTEWDNIPKGTLIRFKFDDGVNSYVRNQYYYNFNVEYSVCWENNDGPVNYKGDFDVVINAKENIKENIKGNIKGNKTDSNIKEDNTSIIIKPKGIHKLMSIVVDAFKSKEDKALENFGLGTVKDLNTDGLREFAQFIYQTDEDLRNDFLAVIVKRHKQDRE